MGPEAVPKSPERIHDMDMNTRRAIHSAHVIGQRKNGTVKRVHTSLAVCAAALAFMAGVAVPDTASAHDHQITRKFCVRVDGNASNAWGVSRDDWVKTQFHTRPCFTPNDPSTCHYGQVENIHTENNDYYKNNFKCGPNRTYAKPDAINGQHTSGKVILDWGSDITFNALDDGPYCFIAYRKKHDHRNTTT